MADSAGHAVERALGPHLVEGQPGKLGHLDAAQQAADARHAWQRRRLSRSSRCASHRMAYAHTFEPCQPIAGHLSGSARTMRSHRPAVLPADLGGGHMLTTMTIVFASTDAMPGLAELIEKSSPAGAGRLRRDVGRGLPRGGHGALGARGRAGATHRCAPHAGRFAGPHGARTGQHRADRTRPPGARCGRRRDRVRLVWVPPPPWSSRSSPPATRPTPSSTSTSPAGWRRSW